MTPIDLTGRVALVSGSAQGLGEGMVDALAAAGAAVAVTDVQEELGEKTAARLAEKGATATFIPLDVTSDEDWGRAVATCIDRLGGLDVLVNNAGIELSALTIDADADALRRMLDINVVGTALGIKHAFAAMRPGGPAGRGGSIINIASVAATIAFPGIAGYSATKSAVDRYTRVAAMESGKLGLGVRVNAIYPGLAPTAMGQKLAGDMVELGLFASPDEAIGAVIEQTPAGRLGEVADMADAVVWLASDASRFVTGAGIPVDGGMGM